MASVMCSYNQINGSYACENQHSLTSILKQELDFQGYVMSDWNAQQTTNGAANAGMDVSISSRFLSLLYHFIFEKSSGAIKLLRKPPA